MGAAEETKQPLVYAHRGAAAVRPENTMAAFTEALRLGAHGIETDVHMSGDGRLVLCHDERLERTTDGSGFLHEHTFAELQKLDAGGWFAPAFAGERLPALDDLLALIAPTQAWLNLEIKSGLILYPGIEAEIIARVKAYGLTQRVVLSSLNHFSLVLAKRLAPEMRTGVLYLEGMVDPWVYAAHLRADALHPAAYAVYPGLIQGAHAAGFAVNAWTVNEAERMRELFAAGVDGLITDHPERALAVLQGMKGGEEGKGSRGEG